MGTTIIALGGFGAIVIMMAVYGYRISAKTAEDYMLGGRTIGVVVMFFFVLFAVSSAWTFYGFPGLLYTQGPGYVMFIWGSVAGFAGLYMFLGPRLWALAKINRFLSPVELLSERYESKSLRLILSVSILVFIVPYVSVQPMGVGAGFEALTGLPAIWGAVYAAAILVVLVILGGMRIVAWVNIFLGIVYITALLGSLMWVVAKLFPDGGLAQAVNILKDRSPEILSNPGPNEYYTPAVLFGTFFVGLLAFTWPHIAIGCMTARDKSLFKWFPLLIFVFGGLFFYIIPFVWGSVVAPAAIPVSELSAEAAANGVELQVEADRVVQTIISRNLPEWFGIFVLLGVVAAAVSTAAVQLMTSSVIVSRDIIQGIFKPDATDKQITGWARWAVIVIVILSLGVSFLRTGAMALYLTDVAVPGFAQWGPALVGGLLWKRGTKQGAIAGTLAGVIYLILSFLVVVNGERVLVLGHPVMGSLVLNVIVYIVVSKLTPRPSETIENQFFDEVDAYLKADTGSRYMADQKKWRLIYKPDADTADVVAHGAAVAEGRIAGKYQLSTITVPDTVIIQRSTDKGIIAGADVKVDKEAAAAAGIQVAQSPRQGRNSARAVGTIPLSEVMAKGSRTYSAEQVDPDAPAVILYTSGTTGNPKGVTLTHRNFHFQCNTVVKSIIPITHEDRTIGVLPFYHVYGLSNALVVSVNNGACIVLIPQYSPQALLEAIRSNKGTIMPAIPSMYQHLLTISRSRKTEIPKSLKFCISGGAPLPLAVLQEFMKAYDTQIIEGYGLTETTSSVCCNGVGGVFKEGSIGPAADGVEMKVVDDNDGEVAVGDVGEIVIRSETVSPGYWNNEDATETAINADGWFHTGDLGCRDQEGFFFITDRKKDLIIRGGFNISPREVEEVLMLHPKIQEAAVIAAKDKRGEEFVKAIVVLQEGESLSEREVVDHCAVSMAPYKQPKVVEFAEALPKSVTGKILRNELRGEATDKRLVEREDT